MSSTTRSNAGAQLTGLMTIVFTDIVGSGQLKEQLGDQEGVALVQKHHMVVRELLEQFEGGQEIDTAGDSFLLVFSKPSVAVLFALQLQRQLRQLSLEAPLPVRDRIGIHIGEVIVDGGEANKVKKVFGAQVDACARVMSLAEGDQILLTRAVFDNARQALKGNQLENLTELAWLNHGLYVIKGRQESLEICEVGEVELAKLKAPADTEKVHRSAAGNEVHVIGWRPAAGQLVPHTKWLLECKLGEGGFGEVWLGKHKTVKDHRVFKFCFHAERVRYLKREMTLFRLLKDRIGDHPHIVGLREVNFDEPPFYVEMEYVEGKDLRTWCDEHGGLESLPVETRLEIVAQVAEALQAAHDAGVIHRDIKPANILIGSKSTACAEVQVKLTDFGIGQVISDDVLSGLTRAGFTQTVDATTAAAYTGTQVYMAPELWGGQPASIRSDIYSLGVVLFQMIVGDFRRPITIEWSDQIRDPLLREDLGRCLAGDPKDRFAAPGELAKSLRSLPARRNHYLARERAAYQRGVLRAAAIASVLVAIFAGLSFYAFRAAKREARERQLVAQKERSARRNLYIAEIGLAQQALDGNNRGRAVELLQRHFPEPGQADLRGWEWHYLWQHCQGNELFTLGQHDNRVDSVAFSPHGEQLASSGHDGVVKLWDYRNRKLIREGKISNSIKYLGFTPDGERIVTSGHGSEAVIWEAATLKPIAFLAHPGPLNALAISPDGKTIATGGLGHGVTLWDLEERRERARFQTNRVSSLAFSPDNQLLAVALHNAQLEIWDLNGLTLVTTIAGHTYNIHQVAFSRSGKLIATVSWDRTARIWETGTWREVRTLRHHLPINTVAFSPDDTLLATAGNDQTIKLWDTKDWTLLSTFQGHADEIWGIAFSPDGQHLASGCKDETIKIWDSKLRRTENHTLLLPSSTDHYSLSPDGRLLAVGSHNAFDFWKTENWTRILQLPRQSSHDTASSLSAQANVIVIGKTSGALRVVDLSSGNELPSLAGHSSAVRAIAFSHDGKWLATAAQDYSVKLWEFETRRELAKIQRAGQIMCMAFSADNRSLAVGTRDWQIMICDVPSGREISAVKAHKEAVVGVAFAERGNLFATASWDGRAKLWEFPALKEIGSLRWQLGALQSVSFSPDGTRLAAGSGEGTIKVWDLEARQELLSLKGHEKFVQAVRFYPDGKALISVSHDAARRWDVTSQY